MSAHRAHRSARGAALSLARYVAVALAVAVLALALVALANYRAQPQSAPQSSPGASAGNFYPGAVIDGRRVTRAPSIEPGAQAHPGAALAR